MDCVNVEVPVADARNAEVASLVKLLIPKSPHVGHVQNLPNVLTSWNFSENVTEMASNHVTGA